MRQIQRYGWKPDLPSIHDKYFCEHNAMGAVAASAADLRPLCPVVYDQSQLGSCTANSIGGLCEFLMLKQKKAGSYHNYKPSRLDIYYWERLIEGTVSTDSGAQISDGMKVVSTQGVPPEFIDGYDITKFADAPTAKAVAYGANHKISDYWRVNQTLSEIKTVIYTNAVPVVFGFTVYESFESDQVANTGIVPMPKTNEQVVGGHAVQIVGYNDKKKLFIVRNSWGPAWGIKGYCMFPYDYILNTNLTSDLWTALQIS